MKEMVKDLAIIGATAAAVGGGMYYLMKTPDAKKRASKKIIQAMDSAEDMIAKKLN